MDKLDRAFRDNQRVNFLPKFARVWSHFDTPLSIGHHQTNSQPKTVRRMLEWLDVKPKQKVLDVGSGSGWTTALLAQLVGRHGQVYAVERIPELVEFGRQNCQNTGVKNAEFFTAGEPLGLPEYAPYDRILVSASAPEYPSELLDQLTAKGKMVVPIGETIHEVTKLPDGKTETTEHPGYIFVPLIR